MGEELLNYLCHHFQNRHLYDEYNNQKWPGATKAINESLKLYDRVLFSSKILNRYLSLKSLSTESEIFQKIHHRLILEKIDI